VKSSVTNSTLMMLIGQLNNAMERLRSEIRYDIEMGSKTLGNNWILVETRPNRVPLRQHLGTSPRSADQFLEGMLRALQAVAFDRDLSRDRDHASRLPRTALTFDPDAKSVRRGAEEEESFPFHDRADLVPKLP
jgi:hypothetical protein